MSASPTALRNPSSSRPRMPLSPRRSQMAAGTRWPSTRSLRQRCRGGSCRDASTGISTRRALPGISCSRTSPTVMRSVRNGRCRPHASRRWRSSPRWRACMRPGGTMPASARPWAPGRALRTARRTWRPSPVITTVSPIRSAIASAKSAACSTAASSSSRPGCPNVTIRAATSASSMAMLIPGISCCPVPVSPTPCVSSISTFGASMSPPAISPT